MSKVIAWLNESVGTQFSAKLHSFYKREIDKDFDGLVWMASAHELAVEEFAPRLDKNFEGYFFNRLRRGHFIRKVSKYSTSSSG